MGVIITGVAVGLVVLTVLFVICSGKLSQSESKMIEANGVKYIVTGRCLNDLTIDEINSGGEGKVDCIKFVKEHEKK